MGPITIRRTPGISCEAVAAPDPAGAGMRRHVHPGNHAAESFVSFIPLFDGALLRRTNAVQDLPDRAIGNVRHVDTIHLTNLREDSLEGIVAREVP
jgi:hypothetical protein